MFNLIWSALLGAWALVLIIWCLNLYGFITIVIK